MERKYLEGLGLEKEVIDKIMVEHGKTVNGTKQELATVTTERDSLQTTLTERDTQLTALKDVNPEDLKQQITDLQAANDTAEKEHAAEIKNLKLTNEIKTSLIGKVHDEEVAASLIDAEKLVIGDDGKIVGLDEQLTSLQESKAYLFKQEESNEPDVKPNFTTGTHQKGSVVKNIAEMSYQELSDLKTNNPASFAELTK